MTRRIKCTEIWVHGHTIYEDDEHVSMLVSSVTIPKKAILEDTILR